GEAYRRLSVALDFGSFERMLGDFETCRAELSAFFDRNGGLDGAKAWAWRSVDVLRGVTPDEIAREAMSPPHFDAELYRRAARALDGGTDTDVKRAGKIAEIVQDEAERLDRALSLFFTKEGDAATWVAKSKRISADPTLQGLLLAEQARLAAARDRCRGAAVALDTEDALTLANAYLQTYAIEKRFAGALDFADLIEKTGDLLTRRQAAAWVLFKLDGGIDHILLDEAQDTAPEQWEIIDQLTGEFFAGAGARRQDSRRGLFVVGDEKQSIYSFQGAQPEQLLRKYEFHRDRATGAGFELRRVDLLTSWRSTPEVLRFVDAVFAPAELANAIQPRVNFEAVAHRPVRTVDRGCIDVWDLVEEPEGEDREAWDAPLDVEREDSANRKLARRIAAEIRTLIDRGEAVWDKDEKRWRPAHAGDVLILVRRRKLLFEEILRALKREGLPVAGADRLALSGHIAFDDLLALARFALFPADELTLAALLKSPFCGLDDEALYRLARRREGGLWAELQRRADEDPLWSAAHGFLRDVLALAREASPFEFYSGLLGRAGSDGASMRRRLLTRLGAEAEDAIDEFMNQVLAAEARGVHDLERLCAELAGLDIVVKREMEAAQREVRVMTAHGAKGLEAPIVILPETTVTQGARGSSLLKAGRTGDEGFLWCGAASRDCPATAAARAERARRESDEGYRLLYVALTRARDRLILCGRKPGRGQAPWWQALEAALAHPDVAPHVRELDTPYGRVRRFGDDPNTLGAAAQVAEPTTEVPRWAGVRPPAEAFARYASPSDLGEGARAPAPSPLATAGGLGRFRRGDLIHRLLQLLPDLPSGERPGGARALLAREPDLSEAQRQEMAAAALAVLDDPRFAEVFGPGSRPEVAVAGTAAALPAGLKISGRIDRLVVLRDRVLVADFKTNRPSPDRIEDADPAYLRQMALYAAVLGEVFPGRRIEAALIWTDGPKLMPVPENLMVQTLAELRRAG
uniref:double-strand break repair helicase AddA n=1 Tax=Phenylobacterium sp. TaxID=1871053 RepID=UPI002811E9F3